MKRSLSILLVLILVFGFAMSAYAQPGEHVVKLPSVRGRGTSYIKVTLIQSNNVWFEAGWTNTKAIHPAPVGASVGTYDITAGQYTSDGNVPESLDWAFPCGEFFGVSTQDPLVAGNEYRIDLFIRDATGNVIKLLSLYFTAPTQ